MDTFYVEVQPNDKTASDRQVVRTAHQSGIHSLKACRMSRFYLLHGHLSHTHGEYLSRELLADPVIETWSITAVDDRGVAPTMTTYGQDHTISVMLRSGVTDAVAENLVGAAHRMGITALEQATTGQCYRLWGTLSPSDLDHLAHRVLANPVIQRTSIDYPIDLPSLIDPVPDDTVEYIPLRDVDDAALMDVSTTRRLALSLEEMRAIQAYFRQEGREPTDAEIEMLAQTWSEHCIHKTFRALVHLTEQTTSDTQSIDGILKSYIRAATEQVAKPWVRSAFVDNAGIIAFDEQWDLAFKVETHNRPSALEPFGGANTGVGGVIRDVLGVSAYPIANTDVLCFGPLDLPDDAVPEGVLHPRRIADGVVHGIEDYGNKMGIPTVNGAVYYHEGYIANPLVFCGCLGLLPHGSHPTSPQDGDLIIVIGGRTGRDGLRGATFSSMEIDQQTSEIAGSAVQIGHPINEKQVQEVVIRARDEHLYHAITDCGAGGLASAVGEMGRYLGAHVQLDNVPLKYAGLRPWEIWLSEAQERMVCAVPQHYWARFQEICSGQDVEAVCIGTFGATGHLRLFFGEQPVGDLSMAFLHEGMPRRTLPAIWSIPPTPPSSPLAQNPSPTSFNQVICDLLAHPNIASREPIIRRYDHEVQGGTMIKPLVGVANHGPSDATVLLPLPAPLADDLPTRGVALAVGLCPSYTDYDPYAMAWAAIDEAFRNVVCVGADPDYVALLDNFCWGNPLLPDRMGSLTRCAHGCYDAAIAYQAPFISGKDSLNNEYTSSDGQRRSIPGTLVISALAMVPDARMAVTMDLKQVGNLLYLIGDTRDETAGSHYALVQHDHVPTVVPQPVPTAIERMRALHRAIIGGFVQACHDCSEGGLAIALAEMCLAGHLGATISLAAMPRTNDALLADESLLFSESLARMIVEVRPDDAPAFEELLNGIPFAQIGRVDTDLLLIHGQHGQPVVDLPWAQLETAWRTALAPDTPPPSSAALTTTPYYHQYAQTTLTSSSPRVLIIHANGTNRDREAARACEWAGGLPEIAHMNQIYAGEYRLMDYHMVVIPGGFSYGDDLGAGTLWALDMRYRLAEELHRFAESGRPLLGICNGFQVLVKSGILPGLDTATRSVTLTENESAHFECRWVYLQPNRASPCIFTTGIDDLIYCPVAHGEGRCLTIDDTICATLIDQELIALRYVNPSGDPVGYPHNPNGSVEHIAGLCNPAGTVLGLMPHPEDHIFPWQHPRWRRGETGLSGLSLFANGIHYSKT